MRTRILGTVLLLALLAGTETAAAAGFGVRGGLGINPDQGVIGLQAEMGGKRLKAFRLAPSADFGFGDNVTTFCGNLDFLLHVPFPGSGGGAYGGLGPTLTYWDVDSGQNDTEIGLSLVAGMRLGMGDRNAYNLEARFGVGDVPDFRILVGVLFGARKASQSQSGSR